MPEPKKRQRRSGVTAEPEPQPQTHTRIELRWPTDAREVEDLANLAGKIKANPGRRGEAGMYVIHLWSRVLHGELSPSAFWEMFGVMPPAPPMYPMMAVSGMYPAMGPGMIPPQGYEAGNGPPSGPAKDPEAEARKQKRSENRKAQADQWSG